jgi:RNA polymerase sigma-70 factor (ECF subfamily)
MPLYCLTFPVVHQKTCAIRPYAPSRSRLCLLLFLHAKILRANVEIYFIISETCAKKTYPVQIAASVRTAFSLNPVEKGTDNVFFSLNPVEKESDNVFFSLNRVEKESDNVFFRLNPVEKKPGRTEFRPVRFIPQVLPARRNPKILLTFASVNHAGNNMGNKSNLDENDSALIYGIGNDDYTCYNQLFVRYYQPLCQFVYGLAANRDDAEDIVQELFLYLWSHRKKMEITGQVSSYLYRMAKNMTLNHIRKETGYRMLLERMEASPFYEEEHALETREFRAALHECMNSLPVRSRQILLLDRISGLKQKDIAEKLHISIQTVKNQIWTSLRKLKRCLELKEVS